jgi:UDP-N-acetylmuramoylalanine--D-glutamate ligase
MTGTNSGRLDTLVSWDADWAGLRVVVTGIGLSGFSAADTLIELGAHVVVVDAVRNEGTLAKADTLKIVGARDVLLGEEHTQSLPLVEGEPAELVVTSPGWSPRQPLLAEAAGAGIPVWGDVELAWRVRERAGRRTADWLTITGTNGKTTTVGLAESMLRASGLRAIAAGNVGTPILDAVRDPVGYDVIAVELSSFQLHWSSSLSPLASVCLNVAQDHVDWHGSYEDYLADKAKVYANTQVACVYNAEQRETEAMVEEADVVEGCRAVGFTTGIPAVSMLGVVDELLVDRASSRAVGIRQRSWLPSATWAKSSRATWWPTPWPPPRWSAPTASNRAQCAPASATSTTARTGSSPWPPSAGCAGSTTPRPPTRTLRRLR